MAINIKVILHLTATNSGVLHDFRLHISKKEYRFLTIMRPGEFYTRKDLFNLGINLNMGMTETLDHSPYLYVNTKYQNIYSLNIIGTNLHKMLVNI